MAQQIAQQEEFSLTDFHRGTDSRRRFCMRGSQIHIRREQGIGMATAQFTLDRGASPLDLAERLALHHDWSYDRSHDDELILYVDGTWCDYQLSFNWRSDIESLHLSCAFDLKVPRARLDEIYRLIARINEQLWVGHFDLWTEDGRLLYRYALLLNQTDIGQPQLDAMIAAALDSCEYYYQAFQFVVWAGKNASEALATTMFETKGQA
jgi:hypothetical protein